MTSPVYADRVQETFTTVGTGAIALGGAVTGYQAFSSVLTNGQSCYYAATDGTNWEVGLGTYASSGNTLARTTILSSSNSGAAVSWLTGTKQIWLDLPAGALSNLGYTGGRNRIINGDMRIDQRNAGNLQSFTAGTAAYSVDRWLVNVTGANCTGAQTSGTGSNQFAYQLNGATGTTQQAFIHRIAAQNIYDSEGQVVTLSAVLANSLLTTVNWVAYYANSANNFSAVTTIASGSFSVTSATTQYSAQITLPSGAENGVEIEFYVGAQTSGYWSITDVQLEPGIAATPFERLPISQQIMQCKAYMNKTFALAVAPAQNVGNSSGALSSNALANTFNPVATWNFPVEMIATPVITTYNPYATNANWATAGDTHELVPSTPTATTQGVTVSSGTTGSGITTAAYYIHLTAISEL